MGRPSDYNQEIADKICNLLGDAISLREMCRADDMPSVAAVCRWLGKHPEFREQYAQARIVQSDTLADEMLDIADNAANDWITRKGVQVVNDEAIRRAQLRIETRKWLSGKLQPKKYGEKLGIDGEIKVSPLTEVLNAVKGRTRSIPEAD